MQFKGNNKYKFKILTMKGNSRNRQYCFLPLPKKNFCKLRMISKEWKLAHTHMRQTSNLMVKNISKKTLLSTPKFHDKIPSSFGDTKFF